MSVITAALSQFYVHRTDNKCIVPTDMMSPGVLHLLLFSRLLTYLDNVHLSPFGEEYSNIH